MIVRHWVMTNGSGMHNVAKSMAEAEQRLGLDSSVIDIMKSETWESALDADIHVAHTHFPDAMRKRVTKPLKLVWVSHGTPEHVFEGAVDDSRKGYGHADGFMLMQHWLKTADARVTFWPRHQWIFQKMVDKGTKIHCVPLGVDLEFWAAGKNTGKYAGSPSVWTAENPHKIKWPLDLFEMWPYVKDELPEAVLHANYLGGDLYPIFYALGIVTGTSYGAHLGPYTFPAINLRDVFHSIDFFIGLVRYGDVNRLSMEAAAAGAKTISYPGNLYADYWVLEGDQRGTVTGLIQILKGEVEPRANKLTPPSQEDMAKAMEAIYQEIL